MFKEPNHFLILFEFLKSTRKLLGTICVIKYYVDMFIKTTGVNEVNDKNT